MESAAQVLLQDLLKNGLVRTEDWEALPALARQRLTGTTDTNRLIDQLLTNNLLTGYQAARIRARKPQWLILGNYRVLDRLGAGSFGAVFKAEHLETRAPVALKVLVPTERKATSPLIGLLAERQTVAQVHHPNIIRALDVGEASSDDPDCPVIYYYVMEYVAGVNLDERVRRQGPLAAAEACDVAYQLADALAAAHQHQLVHRDLKPSNVLLTETGQAKLLDFGLVRSFRAALGNSQMSPSQPAFLAPELADSKATMDIRADLYGLGATLYWCLTGKSPFPTTGDWKVDLEARAKLAVPTLKDLARPAPDGLEAYLGKLLAYRPEERPATPTAVMLALTPFRPARVREEPVALPEPVSAPEPQDTNPILLIDPDDELRATCQAVFAEERLATDEAESGKRGLELALTGAHDVIVLAAEMADLSGVELLRYLRSHPPRPNVRLLVLCADATPEAIGQVLAAGADDYLTKPVDPLQLLTRVKTALHVKHAKDMADAAVRANTTAARADQVRVPVSGRRFGRLLRPLGRLFGV